MDVTTNSPWEVVQQARAARAARAAERIEELTATRLATHFPSGDPTIEQMWAHEQARTLYAARLAGWWTVLGRNSWGPVAEVYCRAAYTAAAYERERAQAARTRARFWAEQAATIPATASAMTGVVGTGGASAGDPS